MFVTCKKVCILWKLESNISVSEGEIPSEFEVRRAIGVFEVCSAYCGASKSRIFYLEE